MGNIFYVIPDRHNKNLNPIEFLRFLKRGKIPAYVRRNLLIKHKPVGGVKVAYQHCLLLKEAGLDAYPLLLGKYHGNFFGYSVETRHIDDVGYQLSEDDVVIIPEYTPHLGEIFHGCKKIMFVQNTPYKNMRDELNQKSYQDLGYECSWYCSQYLGESVARESKAATHFIPNYIDYDVFKTLGIRLKKTNTVLALPRKNVEDLRKIHRLVKPLGIHIDYADGLTEAELVKKFQQTDIFLATGYPEGFGLPPLEAMACGCAVVGFTGGGAKEFMLHKKSALVADDGDVLTAAAYLISLVFDPELKEAIRTRGMEISQRYSKENTKRCLLNYFQ